MDRKARREEAPDALWSPVPLTETAIFVGLVLVLVGFFAGAPAPLFVGIALVSVAALELAIREHFAGYRSHSSLLAAVVAVLACALGYVTSLPQEALVGVALIVFAIVFHVLRQAFARRAGGLGFRV